MGRYIEQNDLDEYLSADALRQLTDDQDSQDVEAAHVAECIDGAEAFVDGHIAHRYVVPITGTTPVLIVELCVIFAVYRLYIRRGRVPENFSDLHKDAMKTLGELQSGDLPFKQLQICANDLSHLAQVIG